MKTKKAKSKPRTKHTPAAPRGVVVHRPCSPFGGVATPQSAKIARHIFAGFDNGKDKCARLAARGGKYPDAETDLGGLCEEAFAIAVEDALREANVQNQTPPPRA